ncbi:Holliday junction branch migration protein RuvA [Marinibactrum halimedae]|uniref:Holliday junction branch migration complex subunit RuvA n=1 Tax=Marinibactrum halimedae TaxID=1444977 RepID=A0AA37T4F7_9GAMM|nr:Holliday junction branch migration protein RuvA [Marinibactrum halimedae]MCD9457505.1 Holliday junction branch migration protein RuvA [Marinibactrum halimedae]GLS25441.1 Holliday junction ATP-dependent DNA helicase RuvA [Marinibactrum halimedae]
MIGRLRGLLAEKLPPQVLIDVNGVFYEVQAPMTSFYRLPELGEAVTLFTHLSISENAHQLFGFSSESERQLFRALIKVNGVGPKMALAVLSGVEADDFVRFVSEGNTAALVKVPGVGKKTAERMIIEMQDRLKDWKTQSSPLWELEEASQPQAKSTDDIESEAQDALIALGYKATEAAKMIGRVAKTKRFERCEDLIREALRSTLPA